LLKQQAQLEAQLANLQDSEATNNPIATAGVRQLLAGLVIPPEDPEPEETAPVATIIWNMRKVKDQALKHWEKDMAKEAKVLAELEEKAKSATAALQEHQSMMTINATWREEARIAIEERETNMKALEDGLKPVLIAASQSAASSSTPAGSTLTVPDSLGPKAVALSTTSATKEQVLAAVQSLQASQPPEVMNTLTMLMDMSYEMTQHLIQASQITAQAAAVDGLQVAEEVTEGQGSGQLLAGQPLNPAGIASAQAAALPAALPAAEESIMPMAVDQQEQERLEAEAKNGAAKSQRKEEKPINAEA
jgi:hypothetical protein